MMLRQLTLSIVISLFFLSLVSEAANSAGPAGDSYSGRLRIRSGQLYLEQNDGSVHLIESNNNLVLASLKRLSDGDLITGHGYLTRPSVNASPRLRLQAIDFVGLQKLIGFWQSQSNEYMEFEDFSRLNLYSPGGASSVYTKSLNYTLAPDSGPGWSLFLMDRTAVDVGELIPDPNFIEIRLFDKITGKISAQFRLYPIGETNALILSKQVGISRQTDLFLSNSPFPRTLRLSGN